MMVNDPLQSSADRNGIVAACRVTINFAIGYFVVSIVTLPLMRRFWLSELPVFAIPQFPKVFIAQRIRTGILMPLIRYAGISHGSFSPDYRMTGPYALVIVYLLPIIIVVLLFRMCKGSLNLRKLWLLGAIECLDLVLFLIFDHSPGFTIY